MYLSEEGSHCDTLVLIQTGQHWCEGGHNLAGVFAVFWNRHQAPEETGEQKGADEVSI